MNPVLTILIPTYRNPQVLQHCLHSLLLNTEFPYKIVVLNNDPNPAMGAYLEKLIASLSFPHIKVRHLGGNKGWMGALNAGMEDVDTPLVCCLNDDVVFIPGQREFWRKLCHLFGDDRVAAVGPSSNYVMGSQSIFFPNLAPAFQAKFLIGFCMVLRTDRLREVGCWDENLPGGDDLDLSIRLRKKGYDLICQREAYLHHIGSLTGNAVHQGYWNSDLQTDRSNNALIRKHGLKAWYELVNGDMMDLALSNPEVNEMRDRESNWVKEHTPATGKGVAVGSGAKRIGKELCIDIARPGDHGAGGRKFEGATNDMTGDACDIPLQDSTVDYLLGLHIFEHLLDPVAVLDEWKRVIKPGGRVVIVCPNHNRLNTMMIDYTHLHAFTPESMVKLLCACGWDADHLEEFAVGTFGVVAYPRKEINVGLAEAAGG